MERCQSMLEEREQYIADFYFKTDVFDAAIFRYQDILKNFKNPELRDHSMIRITLASLKTKNYTDCIKYADQFADEVSAEKSKTELKELAAECKVKGN